MPFYGIGTQPTTDDILSVNGIHFCCRYLKKEIKTLLGQQVKKYFQNNQTIDVNICKKRLLIRTRVSAEVVQHFK